MKQLTKLSLGFVVVVVASLSIGKCYTGDRAEWEARVQRVEEHARHLRVRAEQAEAQADSLSEAADEALRAAESVEAALRVRIDTVRAETPDSLRGHPAIVRRDSIIDAQSDVITQVRRSFELERQSSGRLRAALADALERGDSLAAVLKDRPGERPWWIPKVGAGLAVGLNSQGQPQTVAGVTVSWEIGLN